ncbi:MAG TPA: SRPBCC domain-containing protein [Candidatus Binatus sp.]|jgi:activator of HSP90 ATPase|nr:SRPBCC domain-containing protein [Candidatus Binatus sp.]
MSERSVSTEPKKSPSRRQLLTRAAATLSIAAMSPSLFGKVQRSMTEKQSTGADATRTSLHQEIDLKASPPKVYEILLDSKQFAAFTGLPADISRDAGGAFTMFGGMIGGRNIELVPNQRIVQAWRPASWDPGIYSIVKFELKGDASHSTVILDHTGFPEGDYAHLDPGWHIRYWTPLEKYLAQQP